MKYDFDKVYERRGTNSLKWDFFKERGHSEDELPLWVADMDFPSPLPIRAALKQTADRGFFGYTVEKYEEKKAVSDWLLRRLGYGPDPEDILFAPGVVFALTSAVRALTEPGDAVMVSQPVYYPFFALVRDTGRKLVINTLEHDENGHYFFDFDAFESQIKENGVKVYILCSPHNPVGRVWTKDELKTVGEICLRNNVTVFSDEIHADFVYEDNKHIPFASVSEEFEADSVTFTSPSKTFNMAGLQIAEVIAHDSAKRKRIRRCIRDTGYAEVSITGLAAMKAAYTQCDDWADEVVSYIYENIIFMEKFLAENIPSVKMTHPEGTYLPWVDCKGLGLDVNDLEDLVRNRAKLWLDGGYIFGDAGNLFQRFNAACPRAILAEALSRLKGAVYQV